MSTVLQKADINARISSDARAFIEQENHRYEQQVERVAEQLTARFSGHGLVLLCGPSASGKTTTAANLQRFLRQRGRQAYTVSLDDFYFGRGLAPRLPDGSYDYETIDALDLPLLTRCMRELLEEGTTRLPQFDFHSGTRRAQMHPLTLADDSLVIFEGIHALNPRLLENLPADALFRIFIGAFSNVNDGEKPLLSGREIRLVRRLLRDFRFRNSSIENTFDMWRQVVRGEELYMMPHVHTADVTFDTTHAYEPAMLGGELLPLLRGVPETSPFAKEIAQLVRGLDGFAPLSTDKLPPDCLLKEFVG